MDITSGVIAIICLVGVLTAVAVIGVVLYVSDKHDKNAKLGAFVDQNLTLSPMPVSPDSRHKKHALRH